MAPEREVIRETAAHMSEKSETEQRPASEPTEDAMVDGAGKQEDEAEVQKYTFFVGPGNNSELVRQTFERRPWWELGKEDDPELNLKWLQVRSRAVAESVRKSGSKQYLNHLDGLTCIGRKNELYQNLKQYCEKEKMNVHEMAPPTFIVSAGELCAEYAEFQRVCRQLESKVKGTIGKSIIKAAAGGDKDDKGAAASSPQKTPSAVNDASSEAASAAGPEERDREGGEGAEGAANGSGSPSGKPLQKAGSVKALCKSPKKEGSFRLSVGRGGMTRGDAITTSNTAGDKNLWILKPTNNNRGNGIKVMKSLMAIDDHLKRKPPGTQVIVQKYIERPLLYKGRKFDIRVLVLVDTHMQVYVYRDAYLRTSTTEYDLDNVQDLFIHLTNYAVQKKKKKKTRERELEEDEIDEDDEPQEEGNNLSMEALSAYIADEYNGVVDSSHVMNRVCEIVVTVMQSVWKKLNPLREKNTFEIFGWDFMVDEEFNVWLIEVNTNPYIGCSSGLLRTIFTGMLEGAARKCIDPYFPPPDGYSLADIPDVEGADLWDKVWPSESKTKSSGDAGKGNSSAAPAPS